MSSSDCPKCQGPRDAKALYCPFCGIVFSRYVAGPPPPPVDAGPPVFAPLAPAAADFAAVAASPAVAETLYEGPVAPAVDRAWNPYQGPGAQPIPRFPAIPSYDLATRGSRLVAQLLNLLVIVGILFAGAFLGSFLASAIGSAEASAAIMILGVGLPLALLLIYNLRLLAESGQSLGKKWMGIRIVRSNGEKAVLSQILIMRYLPIQLIGAIPILGPIVGLIDLLMIFGDEQRCLHDRIADTLVVRG